jgi:TonB family protein
VVRGPEFVGYFEHVKRQVRRGWIWGQQPDSGLKMTVGFSILPDGRVVNIKPVEPSGNLHFDQSVLNAVRNARKDLGPPPETYQRDFADVQLTFRASDLSP